MLLLVFRPGPGGGRGWGEFLRSAGCTQSQLPASSHPSWRHRCTSRTKWKCYCTSNFAWGGFSDPGHFLFWGRGEEGGGGHKIPHEARTLHNTREEDQTRRSACNKYLPTGRAALSEFFSTLRERVATSLGGCWERGAGPCTEAGLNSEKPLEKLSPTCLPPTPPPGLPDTKIDSLFPSAVYLHERY